MGFKGVCFEQVNWGGKGLCSMREESGGFPGWQRSRREGEEKEEKGGREREGQREKREGKKGEKGREDGREGKMGEKRREEGSEGR